MEGNTVLHFTKEDEAGQAYGWEISQVIYKYLENGYELETSQTEIEAVGKKYKVLKRDKVTSFYDENGNTLFDVENGRLAEEYNYMKNAPADETEEPTQPTSEIGKTIASIERQAFDSVVEQNAENEQPEESNGGGCHIAKQIDETRESDLKCSGGIDEKCEDCEKLLFRTLDDAFISTLYEAVYG